MNNWKLIVATVVIFGTGVVTGGLLVNYVKQHPLTAKSAPANPITSPVTNSVTRTNISSASVPSLPEILSKPFLPKLDGLLHLSPEQRKAIEKIISDGQGQMKKVMSDARNDIRNQLKGEQRKQFDELMKSPSKKSVATTNSPASTQSGTIKKTVETTTTNANVAIVPTNSVSATTNAP